MIRIKVFPLKKILYKLQIVFLLSIFLIIILVSISLAYEKNKGNVQEVISMAIHKRGSKVDKSSFINDIIKRKVSILYGIDYDDLAENEEQNIESTKNIITKNEDNVIEDNNIKIEIKENEVWDKPSEYFTEKYENGKIRVGNILISNYSKLALDLNELKKVSKKAIDKNSSFLIFHTHTSETYTIDKEEYSDYYRSQNEEYNMISVGKALAEELNNKGYKVLHEKTVHDFPSYNGAYKSSLKTIETCLKKESFDFVIDVHRDAISSNESFRPTVEINGESAAKLMFVVGTNSAGLSHDNWMENLKLAIMIQNRAEEMYPGLFRELHLSNSRYNQQVSDGALILEVGATGNTLEEAKCAMKYLANVLDSME